MASNCWSAVRRAPARRGRHGRDDRIHGGGRRGSEPQRQRRDPEHAGPPAARHIDAVAFSPICSRRSGIARPPRRRARRRTVGAHRESSWAGARSCSRRGRSAKAAHCSRCSTHCAAAARSGAPRFRRQRVARAQDAAHIHRRIRGDPREGGTTTRERRRKFADTILTQCAAHAAAGGRSARPLAHRGGRLAAGAARRCRRTGAEVWAAFSERGRPDIRFTSRSTPDPSIAADPDAVRQILTNLLTTRSATRPREAKSRCARRAAPEAS